MRDKNSIIFMLIIFASLILPLTIGFILVSYIKSLERKKCACSNDIRRKYVKFYGYFLLIFSILVFVINIIFSRTNELIESVIRIISFSINFLAAYLLYSYSNILEDASCECSESWRRTFMKFYGYFIGITYSFIAFCLIIAFIFHLSLGDDKLIKNLKA